ncbi:MAG: NERD domain-containing protein [Fibrobacter sp.]|nr:NERD domain-containing protein [Fibrobacter sp.]
MNKTTIPLDFNKNQMSLEKARKVAWHSTKQNKSLGELYDKGLLTIEVLKREIQNNEDQYIRDACEVLLQQKMEEVRQKMLQGVIPSSYEEARFVICPHKRFLAKNKGINYDVDYGTLIDNDILEEKDYYKHTISGRERCAQYNEQSAAAAFFMLAEKHNRRLRISKDYGPLKVTSNFSYSEMQKENLATYKGVWLGSALMFCVLVVVLYLIYAVEQNVFQHFLQMNVFVWIVAIMGAAIIVIIMNKTVVNALVRKIDSFDDEIGKFRKGMEGEDHVVEIMRECLDGRFHVYRNMVIPKCKHGDIDCVLVTPKEILAIEVKNCEGDFYVKNKKWKRYSDGDAAFAQPIMQVERNAGVLANYLDPVFLANNVRKWVKPTVVLANSKSQCKLNNENTDVWEIGELREKLSILVNGVCTNEKFFNDVCNRLDLLYG